MKRSPEQDAAPDNTYENVVNFLGKNWGISIVNSQLGRCAFVMSWKRESEPLGVSISLHELNSGRISLAQVDMDDSIPFSTQTMQPEPISPRRNLIYILIGIGMLIGEAETIVKPFQSQLLMRPYTKL